MLIIGCDFHTRYQQIAMVDEATGEFVERRLDHESGEAGVPHAPRFSEPWVFRSLGIGLDTDAPLAPPQLGFFLAPRAIPGFHFRL
jgi:hypothetical protein